MSTKAAARRWFNERIGHEVSTRQVRPDGMVWEPGVRVVTRKGATRWSLDGSTLELTANHVVLAADESKVVLEWLDDDGTTIHWTTYSDVIPDEEEDEG